MIIQYYCYRYNKFFFAGFTINLIIAEIGFGISECEWIVPGTITE